MKARYAKIISDKITLVALLKRLHANFDHALITYNGQNWLYNGDILGSSLSKAIRKLKTVLASQK